MIKITLLSTLLCTFFSFTSSAKNFWKDFAGQMSPNQGKQESQSFSYKVATLNQEGLQQFLQGLPLEQENAQILSLPGPDGLMREFKIWKTPIMEKALQIKFPSIQTYTALSVQEPQVMAKIDFSPEGFHALVFDQNRTYVIDPLVDGFKNNYLIFYKIDNLNNLNPTRRCEVDDQEDIRPLKAQKTLLGNNLPEIRFKENGNLKRNYRLALSCTGEYARAVAGNNPSKAAVFSAMVTTLNRVNGIYEKEISVTLTLVDNNDFLIYTDPNTDPFPGNANNDGISLMNLNQSNTNSVIGEANYDIGHIFSTGGGGIAALGSVCAKNSKARGVTGLSQPFGDIFNVDFVAHEMGHQFGAEHVFNANTGSCNYNGNRSTAYEPGGGTTIMAYAGICGVINNVQNHSDAYFHANSLAEMSDFLRSNYGGDFGGGATCGVTSIGHAHPELSSIAQNYKIPYNTPFELTSSMAIINEPGVTTYNWEQWNLGNFRSDEPGAATFMFGPSFRSFIPSQNRTRVFPRIDSLIIGNTDYKGERLPQVERELAFKLTVRNVVDGWGSFNISDDSLTVSVLDTRTPFSVTSQKEKDIIWYKDASETITWRVSRTNSAPINCAFVDVFLSIDGGYTYPILLASNVPNTGSADVLVPNLDVDKARIKVKAVENIFFNINQESFKISSQLNAIKEHFDHQISIFPNPAIGVLNIKNQSHYKLSLKLLNYLGQEVWQGGMAGEMQIRLESFARGIYFLSIENQNDGKRIIKKISLN